MNYNIGHTPLCVCVVLCYTLLYLFLFPFHVLSAVILSLNRPTLFYLITVRIYCHYTDLVLVNGHDRIILVTGLGTQFKERLVL